MARPTVAVSSQLFLTAGLLFQRGIGLGLFHEDPDFSYAPLLDEIAETGANHVSLVVPWYQADVRATDIHPHPRFTAPDATLLRTMRQARARGLEVLLCPILRLEDPIGQFCPSTSHPEAGRPSSAPTLAPRPC